MISNLDNLIINKHGRVKVADFGLALDIHESMRKGELKKIEGSPHYMSPEQAMLGEISFSSDIYSLGSTFYHLLTSIPPFTGHSPASIIAKHVTDYPRSPREINPRLSKGICMVIQKMMAKRPEDRFKSMDEVISELRILQDDRTSPLDRGESHWFIEEKEDSNRLTEMMTIVEVNKAISQEKNLDQLLFRVVHEITHAMEAERSTLYIYDPDKREICAKVAEGMNTDKVICLRLGEGIAGTVALSLKTETINDVYKDPRFNKQVDAVTGFRTKNMICMPILGTQLELLGVIQVLNKKKGDFTNSDESLLSAMAVNVGITLDSCNYFCINRPKCKEVV